MSGRMNMPKAGRTRRGKAAPLDSLDHYLRKAMNRLDGASQRERKAMLEALGFEPEKEDPTKDQVIARVKIAVTSFDELVKLAGGEKLPGCGAIVPFSVGRREPADVYGPARKGRDKKMQRVVQVERQEDTTVELGEEQALERLRRLQLDNWYKTGREAGRDDDKNRWPGFVQVTATMSPGDSRALVAAVNAGAMGPAEFKEHLRALTHQMMGRFRETTKLGAAKRGLEPLLCAWHLEQGCLHCHIWASDIDVQSVRHARLGCFATEGQKDARPRLTLNSLGICGVSMRRHRAAGHAPGVKALKDGTVCGDFKILEIAEAHRAAKKLGPCWDAVLADETDTFWAGVMADPKLAPFRSQGHREWDKDWTRKRAAQLKRLQELATAVVPELQAVADRAAVKVAEEKKRLAEREKELEGLALASRAEAEEAARAKAEAERVRLEAAEQLAAERLANQAVLEHAVRPFLAKNLTELEGGAEDARQGKVPSRACRHFEPLAGNRRNQYVLTQASRALVAAGAGLREVAQRCRRLVDLDNLLRMEPEFAENVSRFEEQSPAAKRGVERG